MKKLGKLMRLRKQMCLEIADDIIDLIDKSQISPEKIADAIELRLPLAYAEAEEEMRVIMDDAPAKPGPVKSIMDRMRDSLGLGKEHSLVQVLKAACERIESATSAGARVND